MPAFQQIFHGNFYLRTSFSNQLIYQSIAAGIGPVGGKPSCFQIIDDGPWVVYIPAFSKGKAVIPSFDIGAPVLHPILIQCRKHLFLCKSKAILIHLRCGCHNDQMIQVGENRFPAYPCDSCHNRPLQTGICLECRIEQASHEFHHLLPVAVYPRLLKGRVIFIQQNDYLLLIISRKIQRKGLDAVGGLLIHHIDRHPRKGFSFLFAQTSAVRQKGILPVQFFQYLEHSDSGACKGRFLNIRKTQKNHRISPLKPTVFFLFPDGQSLKNLSLIPVFHREKALQHVHIQGLAKSAGTGNQRHIVSVFPPLPDKICFINIKAVFHYQLLKTLNPYPYDSRHGNYPPYSKTLINSIRFCFYQDFLPFKCKAIFPDAVAGDSPAL